MNSDHCTKEGVQEGGDEKRGVSIGTKTIEVRGFGSSFVAIGRDSPHSAAVLTKMVFASPDRHFCQPSTSVLGLNPTKHMKGIPAYQTRGFPTLETSPRLLHPVAKAQPEKNAA